MSDQTDDSNSAAQAGGPQAGSASGPFGAGDSRRTCGWPALLGILLIFAAPVAWGATMSNAWLRSTGAAAWVLILFGVAIGVWAALRDGRGWVRALAAVDVFALAFSVYAFFVFAALPAGATPRVGAAAADFTLLDHAAQPVSLKSSLAGGPTLLVFYRGFW